MLLKFSGMHRMVPQNIPKISITPKLRTTSRSPNLHEEKVRLKKKKAEGNMKGINPISLHGVPWKIIDQAKYPKIDKWLCKTVRLLMLSAACQYMRYPFILKTCQAVRRHPPPLSLSWFLPAHLWLA